MMRQSAEYPNRIQGRRSALGIFRENLTLAACPEAELLETYGDPYWAIWIREPLSLGQLADLLSVHLAQGFAPSNLALECCQLRRDEITLTLERAVNQRPEIKVAGDEINPAAAVDWLLEFREHLVPVSLRRYLHRPADLATRVSPARLAGGRPRKWDWDAFDREIVRLANTPDGLPERAKLQRDMLDWCAQTWGDTPSDSNVRDHIARLYLV